MARRIAPIGAEVRIRFLDHVEDADEPLECVIYGRVGANRGSHYVVVVWDYAEARSERVDIQDHNVKCFTILKSTILDLTRLGRVD